MRPKHWLAIAFFAAATVGLCGIGIAAAASGGGDEGEVAAASQATAQYHQIDVATGDGYGLFKDVNGIACIEMTGMPAMGAMGIHYVNGALVGDPSIDAAKPEALRRERQAAPRRARIRGPAERLGREPLLAAHAPRAAVQLHARRESLRLAAFYSLHAWIWKHNPSGTFAMWNPTVSCAAA